jgi:hypothetical protein
MNRSAIIDPTGCSRYLPSARMGTECFSYRTFNPNVWKQVSDPIGPENDRYLKETIQKGDLTVVAWGNRGHLNHRSQQAMG